MSDLPTPKFKIGDTVYHGALNSREALLPCPDCKDTRQWTVTTAAGATFPVRCQRCNPYINRDVPSLGYTTWEPYARQLTIGSVRIDTASTEEKISYMANETGIGSGSIWAEGRLHSTREEAMAAAQIQANLKNTEHRETPKFIEKAIYADIHLESAVLDRATKAMEASWWKWRHLINAIKGLLKEPGSRDDLIYSLGWEVEYSSELADVPEIEEMLRAIQEGSIVKAEVAAQALIELHDASRAAHTAARPERTEEEEEG